jgi:hypothetical protein
MGSLEDFILLDLMHVQPSGSSRRFEVTYCLFLPGYLFGLIFHVVKGLVVNIRQV